MTAALRITRLIGAGIEPQLQAVAALRIRVFREFPYLYDGSAQYEADYLRTYADSPRSVMVLVEDGDQVVGASTGLPLADETPEFKRPFIEHGYDVARVFYCGESVLLSGYRGRGIGVRFFEERESHARSLGGIDWIAFCAVQRPPDHPRRPAGYVPLDRFWQNRGYARHRELATEYVWQDLDESQATAKPMQFWLKPLER